MEKKTKFKLKFVKSHLQKPKIHKSVVSIPKKKPQAAAAPPRLMLLKYYNPIHYHRVIGDMVFTDQLPSDPTEYMGLSSMWASFKSIQSIRVSQNFLLCSFEDNDNFTPVELLTERLNSLGNSESHELALAIQKYLDLVPALPFTKKEEVAVRPPSPSLKQHQLEFTKCLKEHEDEPMVFYHYQMKPGKVIRTKTGVNRLLRDMSFKDDIRVFEESLFLVPGQEYFQYMTNHMKACFAPNTEPVKLYFNTIKGVKTIYSCCHSFMVGEERVVVLTFPKEIQSEEIKKLFEEVLGKREKTTDMEIEEETRNKLVCRNTVFRNLSNWENLMKQYFQPYIECTKTQHVEHQEPLSPNKIIEGAVNSAMELNGV